MTAPDEFHRGMSTPDPRDGPRLPKAREIYVPDRHIDSIKVKTRDFGVGRPQQSLVRNINNVAASDRSWPSAE